METVTSGVALGVWQGWGVFSVIAALTVVLATILGWLLPFPDRSLNRQLADYHDRMALRDRLGGVGPLQSYLLTVHRFDAWLQEWFGPATSGQAFERCVAIAFIFPVGLFLITLIANGLNSDKIQLSHVLVFAAGFALIASAIITAFNNLLRFVERLWKSFGGDRDVAHTISRILLGALAMMIAFTIAFAIASTFSGQITDARAVLGAMAGGFAVAVVLAISYALAGAALFTIVLVVLGGAALAFASQFAFLLFLFFVMLPFINASMDWLSWSAARFFLRKAGDIEQDRRGALHAIVALICSFLTGAFLMIALAILLPNAIEIVNTLFTLAGLQPFNWRALAMKATQSPWGDGLFVTGMLMTTLVPACAHLVVGLTGVLARYTPGARTAAESITDHAEAALPANELRPVKLTLIFSRGWYVISGLVTLAVIIGGSIAIYVTHAPVAQFLSHVAFCSTSWSQGKCSW